MGIATFPAASGGLASVVKSIQRGVASSAGTITITSVDTSKCQVTSFSTGSAGTVAATGYINAATGTAGSSNGNITGNIDGLGAGATAYAAIGGNYNSRYGIYTPYYTPINLSSVNINSQNINLNATNLSGGYTDITAATYGAYLTDSTTLTVTGPCRYEIVEYY